MNRTNALLCLSLTIIVMTTSIQYNGLCQDTSSRRDKRFAPTVLPGKGMQQYDFLYAGEGRVHTIFIVQNGQIVWSFRDTANRGEMSDAVLLSNGNIVYAHQHGVSIINHNKEVLWTYKPPAGCEIHTAQPIGTNKVVFLQNGDSLHAAIVRVVNHETGTVLKEFSIPVGNPNRSHLQFRHARLTKAGTILVAHMDCDKVCEYDINGKELLSISVPSPWSAIPLDNGNILVSSNKHFVREFTRKGDIVWEFLPSDVPEYALFGLQLPIRLPNGNTIINSWNSKYRKTNPNSDDDPVQFIEVTPDKKVVWALHEWTDPVNLGPSTILQLLSLNQKPEDVHFGDIR